ARLLPFGDGRALALVRDVTRRIHLETELVRRAETLRGLEENVFRLLDEIETAALALDAEGRCVFASEAALQALDCKSGDPRGRPWPEILSAAPVERREMLAWAKRPRASRGRRPLDLPSGRALELDLREDPLNPDRQLLFLYDI